MVYVLIKLKYQIFLNFEYEIILSCHFYFQGRTYITFLLFLIKRILEFLL